MNRIALLLWCAASATAESNFAPPVVGVVRDTHRQLRPVYGVAGNFVLRGAIPKEALNWAFAGAGGLMKADTELLTLDSGGRVTSHHPAPQGDAVLSAGAAFFPGTSELWLIGAHPDRKMRIEPDALGGHVVALGVLNGRSLPLAVCRGSRVWLVTVNVTSSAVTRETLAPGVIGDQGCAGALLWLDGNFLLATAHELTIQTAAGDERHLPLAGGVDGAAARTAPRRRTLCTGGGGWSITTAPSDHRRQPATLPAACCGDAPVIRRLLLLACLGAGSVPAQLSLFVVQGNLEAPINGQYGFGTVSMGDVRDAPFRLRNTGKSPTPLTVLSLAGVDFTFVNSTAIPQSIAGGAAVDFIVRYEPTAPSSSATFTADGVSAVFFGRALSAGTVWLDDGSDALQFLEADAVIDFRSAVRGSTVTRYIVVVNPSTTDKISINNVVALGASFHLTRDPLPFVLSPGASARMRLDFTPVSNGTQPGTLEIDQRSFHRTGKGLDPAAPIPSTRWTCLKRQARNRAN